MAAIKTVLVEDNLVTVRSLQETIDWSDLGCELVGIANDGLAGKELILRERPDIVLTDIQMPEMNGLEMLEAVREEMPELIPIILTGYDQFQYASRAIKLGVFDYILKPVRNNEVEKAIRRAADLLRRKHQSDVAAAEADRLRSRSRLLSLLTNMSHSGQDVHAMMQDAGLDSPAYYITILQPEEYGSVPLSLLNGIDDLLQEAGVREISVILYDSIVLYVQRQDSSDAWRDEAEDICDLIRRAIPEKMHIGVSRLETHHMVRQTYQQARQALYESAMADSGKEVFYREKSNQTGTGYLAETRHRVDALAEEAELTDESADKAAAELVRISGQQYSHLRALVSLYGMLLSKKFSCTDTASVDKALSASWFVTDEAQVSACLRQVCDALKTGREKTDNQCSLLTRNVLNYIRVHGADKLSLSEVADKFHVSANYLSALVRKETGITFHEHIINAKMEIAHTMLADPRILVEEVAYAVGYSNYVSFYNVFKQREHMTPTEYRNSLELD